MKCKKNKTILLSRVRVYAHITGDFAFLLSQVSQFFVNCYISIHYPVRCRLFNDLLSKLFLIRDLPPKKHRFYSLCFAEFPSIFSPTFSSLVTLVTAKKLNCG